MTSGGRFWGARFCARRTLTARSVSARVITVPLTLARMSVGDFLGAASVLDGAAAALGSGAFGSAPKATAAWRLRIAKAVRSAAVMFFMVELIFVSPSTALVFP